MALALDPGTGSARNTANPGTSVNVGITTANANDAIVVLANTNGGPVVSVTSSPALFFTQRATVGTNPNAMEEWWSSCPTAQAYTITVTQTSNAFILVDVFAVSGAPGWNSNPFDGSAVTNPSSYASITTVNPHTFIFGCTRDANSGPSADTGSGWTQLQGGSLNVCDEYQIFSTIQSGLTISFIGSSTFFTIMDAITGDTPASANTPRDTVVIPYTLPDW
jgi:hypothetical protein